MPVSSQSPGVSRLDFTVPWPVRLLVCAFLAIQLMSVLTVRGIDEPQGYPFNPSKIVALNVWEEDGTLSLAAVLGYLGDKDGVFASFFNTGGPVLHMGRLIMAGLDAVGVVKVFDDPHFYVLYPEEFRRVWQAYGLYKLLFIAFLPIAVYWLGANSFSRRAGITACALIVFMPFLPAFEQRMKPDSISLTLGLLSLLFQLDFLRGGRKRSYWLACALLGASFSVKTITLPLGLSLALSGFAGSRTSGPRWRDRALRVILGVLLLGGVFLALNPRIVPLLVKLFLHFSSFISGNHAAKASPGLLELMLYRFTHMSPFFGPLVSVFCLPALAYGLFLGIRRGQSPDVRTSLFPYAWIISPRAAGPILAGLAVIHLLYIFTFVGEGLAIIDYYAYPAAAYLAVLMGALLCAVAERTGGTRRLGIRLIWCAVTAVVALEAADAMRVLEYLGGKTNRQLAHAWLNGNTPDEASIGVPLAADSSGVNAQLRLDPFRRRVVCVGPKGELLGQERPDYLLWPFGSPAEPGPSDPAYRPVAAFAFGRDLPQGHDYALYQDEGYSIFRRQGVNAAGQTNATGPQDTLEHALFSILSRQGRTSCNILALQALRLHPGSLELLRKTPDTILPLPTRSMAGSFRSGLGQLAYLHNLDAPVFALWGIQYVLSKAGADPEFDQSARAPGSGFRPAGGELPLDAGGNRQDLWENLGYLGQALFIPDAPAVVDRAVPFTFFIRGRDRILPYGKLCDAAESPTGVLEVHLRVRTDVQADLILKGGPRRLSILLGPGSHDLRVPYVTAGGSGEIGYEINAIGRTSLKAEVLALRVGPLALEGASTAHEASVGLEQAFATTDSPVPGRMVFALPWHRYWRASVDGRPANVEKGPANTVAVRVNEKGGLVSLWLAR